MRTTILEQANKTYAEKEKIDKVGDDYPMSFVNWDEALEFCRKLTEQERLAGRLPVGYEYSLPTEAQWEYAARGGNRSNNYKYSGSNHIHTVAWTTENAEGRIHPVGMKRPNELGIYDMSGNVYELCFDKCGPNNDVKLTEVLKGRDFELWMEAQQMGKSFIFTDTYRDGIEDPCCQKAGDTIHITRGGSFCHLANQARVADRNECAGPLGYQDLGFRIVLTVTKGKSKQSSIEESKNTSTQEANSMGVPLPNNIYLEMVRVKAGSFMMGSSESAADQKFNETQHLVTIVNDYWIGKYEVTQGQWKAFMNSNPSHFQKGDNYPVEQVTWNDAMVFCQKLTEYEHSTGCLPVGYEYTLPTEAQWEYAARGGHFLGEYHIYSGSDSLDNVGWYDGNAEKSTHPVGTKHMNKLGIHDMSGNVQEWCRDRWQQDAPDGSLRYHSAISSKVMFRVLRGGSWFSDSRYCRSAYQNVVGPTNCGIDFGFRVALAPVQ